MYIDLISFIYYRLFTLPFPATRDPDGRREEERWRSEVSLMFYLLTLSPRVRRVSSAE